MDNQPKPLTRHEQFSALLKQGWSRGQIAEKFGCTRQNVSSILIRPFIRGDLRLHAVARDEGRCGLCGEETSSVRVVNLEMPITLDNIGLLCGRCATNRAWDMIKSQRPVKAPRVCAVDGCGLVTDGRKYCGDAHREIAFEQRWRARSERLKALKEKHCSVCNITKPVSEFYLHRAIPGTPKRTDVYYTWCKKCCNKRTAERMYAIMRDKTSYKYVQYRRRQQIATMRYQEKQKKLRATPIEHLDPKVAELVKKLRGL